MTRSEIKRCRDIISRPLYYKDRAIEMGRLYGIWSAVYELRGHSNGSLRKMNLYGKRMIWYANKDRDIR